MTAQEIYQKLIDYIENLVAGFPESEHMMPMITSFITPEEAEFITGFPMSDASLDQIAAIKEMDPVELSCASIAASPSAGPVGCRGRHGTAGVAKG